MHETGVCRNIVETVERHALMGHAKRVTAVHITLGEVHDVVPEILIGAFEWMARGTVVEGAKMTIDRLPFTVECECCGNIFRLDSHDSSTWSCPECHEHKYHMHTGREFLIDNIEVEGFAEGEEDTTAQAIATFEATRLRSAADRAVSGKRPAGATGPMTGRAAAMGTTSVARGAA